MFWMSTPGQSKARTEAGAVRQLERRSRSAGESRKEARLDMLDAGINILMRKDGPMQAAVGGGGPGIGSLDEKPGAGAAMG